MLDEKDPSMNLDLLRVLVCDDKRSLVAQLGVDRLFELDKVADKFSLIGSRLYRVYRDNTKEIPAFCKRDDIVKELHEAGGHVGITKTY